MIKSRYFGKALASLYYVSLALGLRTRPHGERVCLQKPLLAQESIGHDLQGLGNAILKGS